MTGPRGGSAVSTESPSDVLLHERFGQLGGMGLEKTAKGFSEQVVHAARASFGDERLSLGGEFGWQLGLDADFLHTAKVARRAWMGRTK